MACKERRSGDIESRKMFPALVRVCHILATIASPNCEQRTSFAPSIKRAKSYVTIFSWIVFSRDEMIKAASFFNRAHARPLLARYTVVFFFGILRHRGAGVLFALKNKLDFVVGIARRNVHVEMKDRLSGNLPVVGKSQGHVPLE